MILQAKISVYRGDTQGDCVPLKPLLPVTEGLRRDAQGSMDIPPTRLRVKGKFAAPEVHPCRRIMQRIPKHPLLRPFSWFPPHCSHQCSGKLAATFRRKPAAIRIVESCCYSLRHICLRRGCIPTCVHFASP